LPHLKKYLKYPSVKRLEVMCGANYEAEKELN